MVEKQAIGTAEDKTNLAAQLRSKELELSAAVNKKEDYDPTEVTQLREQVWL